MVCIFKLWKNASWNISGLKMDLTHSEEMWKGQKLYLWGQRKCTKKCALVQAINN